MVGRPCNNRGVNLRWAQPTLRLLRFFSFWLRWFLAIFCFVLGGEFGFFFGVADKALRVGAVVLFAPIAFSFEIAGELDVA